MKLKLEQNLPHQQIAVENVISVFDGVEFIKPKANTSFSNPFLDFECRQTLLQISKNIKTVQALPKSNVGEKHRMPAILNTLPKLHEVVLQNGHLNLDIRMETGTGKTFVYTNTMFALNANHGISKFILVVPTLPIKANAQQFLSDDYTNKFFKSLGYNAQLKVFEATPASGKKTKRENFPQVIREFLQSGSIRRLGEESPLISVLIVNGQLLSTALGKTSKSIGQWIKEYHSSVNEFDSPLKAFQSLKPFIIIDEPHKFKDENTTIEKIRELKPQCIIRYGATFPRYEKTIGFGKATQKITEYDYKNLLYDLTASESFNQGLIKGVAKEHPQSATNEMERVKVVTCKAGDKVVFKYISGGGNKSESKEFKLGKGDSLSNINPVFVGTIERISKNSIELSTGVTLFAGMEFPVNAYMSSYQEAMITLALKRHFETERENFARLDKDKIKTLALFFIGDITGYRQTGKKEPYLLKAFERILVEQATAIIKELKPSEAEYKDFLQATIQDVSQAHAGYFSKDNQYTDENIKEQVDIILRDKKSLLSFKRYCKKTNKEVWNVRRFLFSKWTLREGWDNPNVFTIAKLRSSGSEISKLQEVGRGLRLPVNESGNRIMQEEFYLNFIVDFTESDFADKLVAEINGGIEVELKITREVLSKVAQNRGIDEAALMIELLNGCYIEVDGTIRRQMREKLFKDYSDIEVALISGGGFNKGKIKDRNREEDSKVKIRKHVFKELKTLWEAINARWNLFLDKDLSNDVTGAVEKILEGNIFDQVQVVSTQRDITKTTDSNYVLVESSSGTQLEMSAKKLKYNEFLKRISKVTSLPITLLHGCLQKQKLNSCDFNERSLHNFVGAFNKWKWDNLQNRFSYKKVSKSVTDKTTSLTQRDGLPKQSIATSSLGRHIEQGKTNNRYLYDKMVYGSPLELENIKDSDIGEVVAYGKIPAKSFIIPTLEGSTTYSPDFMYVVKDKDGNKTFLVVETKDIQNVNQLRGTETSNIDYAEVFFDCLKKDGYNVRFKTQMSGDKIKDIVKKIQG